MEEKWSTGQPLGDVSSLVSILGQDVDVVASRGLVDPGDRRAYVRAVWALLEAIAFSLKNIAQDRPDLLTSAELAMVREETFALTKDGEAVSQRARLDTLANIRFAFSVAAKCTLSDMHPIYHDEGWNAVCHSLRVRHRLNHPKHHTDLHVSDEELEWTKLANAWSLQAMAALAGGAFMQRITSQKAPSDNPNLNAVVAFFLKTAATPVRQLMNAGFRFPPTEPKS